MIKSLSLFVSPISCIHIHTVKKKKCEFATFEQLGKDIIVILMTQN